MRNGRIDGIFRDVALHASIVVVALLLRQTPALTFHFVGSLPGTKNHLTDSPHGLRIRTHHANGTQVVQNILCSNGLRTDARLRKRDILRQAGIEVMTDHEHI